MVVNSISIQSKEVHLNVSVNYFCNQKCIFCSEWNQEQFQSIRDQSSESYYAQIAEWRARYDDIMFTSGEPTLNKNLFDYARHAKACGYKKIGLVTNGTTLAHDHVRQNILQSINYVIVSVHGSYARLHDRMVGGRGIFDRVLHGLLLLMKERTSDIRIDLSFVLNRINLPDIYRYLDLFIGRIGVDRVLINVMRPDGYAGMDFTRLSVRYSQLIAYFHGLSPEKKVRIVEWVRADRLVVTDIPVCILKRAFGPYGDIDFYRLWWKMELVEKNMGSDIGYSDNNEDKEFPPVCRRCLYQQACEGVYSQYLGSFWSDEFQPIHRNA